MHVLIFAVFREAVSLTTNDYSEQRQLCCFIINKTLNITFLNRLSFQFLFSLTGVDEFLPNNWFMDFIAKYVCGFAIGNPLCKNIIFLIAGPDGAQMNSVMVKTICSDLYKS